MRVLLISGSLPPMKCGRTIGRFGLPRPERHHGEACTSKYQQANDNCGRTNQVLARLSHKGTQLKNPGPTLAKLIVPVH